MVAGSGRRYDRRCQWQSSCCWRFAEMGSLILSQSSALTVPGVASFKRMPGPSAVAPHRVVSCINDTVDIVIAGRAREFWHDQGRAEVAWPGQARTMAPSRPAPD